MSDEAADTPEIEVEDGPEPSSTQPRRVRKPAAHPDHRRTTKIVVVFGLVLILLALVGLLRADRDVEITQDEAVEIAETALDFEPDLTVVRLVRQGVGLQPNWAVSFSTQNADGTRDQVRVVRVDAITGEIISVANEE